MTDKDLINALKCCVTDDCDVCPYKRNCKNVMCDVLDLINRQQAEIERLKKELQIARDAYIMLQTKNEIAKSEAVKEFADKLKEKVYSVYSIRDLHKTIDKLVKEMVGDEE